jgi:hypothetical protein
MMKLLVALVLSSQIVAGGGHRKIFSSSAPLSLLDYTPNGTSDVKLACSFSHALKQSWTAHLIQITRASDSTTSDVTPLSTGAINQTTITTFCSGTTCTVSKCYDESGNTNDITFSPGPIIYQSGAVITNGPNSRVAASFTGSQSGTATVTLTGSTVEGMMVGNFNNPLSTYQGLLEVSNGSSSCSGSVTYVCIFLNSGGTNAVGAYYTGTGGATQAITWGTAFYADMFATLSGGSPEIAMALNGGSFNTTAASANNLSATTAIIGTDIGGSNLNGYAQDIVLFVTQSNSTQRTNAHTVESTFFGTP